MFAKCFFLENKIQIFVIKDGKIHFIEIYI